MMNMRDYGNPEIMLLKKLTCEQNYTTAAGYNCSINSSSWKGYLTKVAILTIAGLASFYLINKKVNLGEKGRSCFLALRKYFPKGKDEDEHDSEDSDANSLDPSYDKYEICPVCLSKLKIGVRASCGHFLCSKCLLRYREIRCTKSPPCPLCRLPLKSVTPAVALDLIPGNLLRVKPASNCESIAINGIAIENMKTDLNQVTSTKDGNNKSEILIACQSQVSYFFGALFYTMNDKRNLIARNFFLVFGLTAILSNSTCEFIRNGNILEFVIPLSLMSIIYAWYFLKV